ncbi:MAG TPA: hypothetical protein VFE45_16160 [Coriobacteriia bacterium]|nr:hypothetical protein [Coriobacteriia bacterium]
MKTPFEKQILGDFRRRLDESSAVPSALVDALVSLASGDKLPSADGLLAAVKANVGDRPK